MAQEVHTLETEEGQTVVGQERSSIEEQPATVSDGREARQDVTSSGVPSAAPPVPPRRSLTAQRRQRTPGERWTLGIFLVVIGGLTWFVFGLIVGVVAAAAAVPAVMCLVAGWLLRSWWGLLASAVVYMAVSALMWVLAFKAGSLPVEIALYVALYEFALFVMLPAVVMSAIGTAIGMYRAR